MDNIYIKENLYYNGVGTVNGWTKPCLVYLFCVLTYSTYVCKIVILYLCMSMHKIVYFLMEHNYNHIMVTLCLNQFEISWPKNTPKDRWLLLMLF